MSSSHRYSQYDFIDNRYYLEPEVPGQQIYKTESLSVSQVQTLSMPECLLPQAGKPDFKYW